jgi:anaerobic magnesium-protoporphyrin IX monomethyl ester cyclase
MMKRTPRVLLVNPPYQRLRGMSSTELPLGLLYIAAVLRKNGFEAKVLNLEEAAKGEDLKSGYLNAFKSYHNYVQNRDNYSHPAWQEYGKFINAYQPDIIGFSVMTPSYSLALGMACFTKKLSDAFIVFGGPHPTLCPEDAAKDPSVDAVIVGEGETAFLELTQLFEYGSKDFLHNVPSAVFRGNGGIVSTALQPLIENLDALPYPDYESLARPALSELQNRHSVIVSRGCPYRCAFCVDHLIWRKRSRFRSHEHVTDEIKYLYEKYDPGNLFFQQDSFLNKPELARSVSADLISAGIRIPWWCAARVDQIHQELLIILKESGLNAVILGIESGSQRILDIMNKKISIPQIERSVALLKENGIKAHAFFMIGVPDETEEDILHTMSLMKRLPLDFISLSVFTPLPQSVLFNRCVELGLMDQKPDWDKFDYQSPENYFSAAIKRERFQALLEQCSALVDEMNSKRH